MWALVLLALVLLVAVSFVPADIELDLERTERLSAHLGFRWLFIRFRQELKRRPERNGKPPRPRRRSPVSTRAGLEILSGADLRTLARRLISRLRASARILRVEAKVRMGAFDPADTGRLWGLVAPLAFWCNRRPGFDLAVEPDFSGACLAGRLDGTLRVSPARLIWAFASTLFSLSAMRLGLRLLRSRRR